MKHNGMNQFTPTKYIPQINNYLIYFLMFFGIFSHFDGSNRFMSGWTGSRR